MLFFVSNYCLCRLLVVGMSCFFLSSILFDHTMLGYDMFKHFSSRTIPLHVIIHSPSLLFYRYWRAFFFNFVCQSICLNTSLKWQNFRWFPFLSSHGVLLSHICARPLHRSTTILITIQLFIAPVQIFLWSYFGPWSYFLIFPYLLWTLSCLSFDIWCSLPEDPRSDQG